MTWLAFWSTWKQPRSETYGHHLRRKKYIKIYHAFKKRLYLASWVWSRENLSIWCILKKMGLIDWMRSAYCLHYFIPDARKGTRMSSDVESNKRSLASEQCLLRLTTGITWLRPVHVVCSNQVFSLCTQIYCSNRIQGREQHNNLQPHVGWTRNSGQFVALYSL